MEFGPEVIWVLNVFDKPIYVTQTVTTTWFIMAVILIGAFVLTRKLSLVPGNKQVVAEVIVDGIYNLTSTTMGKKFEKFGPYVGTLLLFIGISNISGLFGLRPPTADLNTTMALALMTFILIHKSLFSFSFCGK